MKRTNITYKLLSFGVVLSFTLEGCIEEFDAEFEDFESAIVVEATITNEMERQQVFLSRTYKFEEEGPTAEINAQVRITEGGNTYTLQETEPGVYVSEQPFAAQPNTAYQLLIETQNGRTYSSNEMTLTDTAQIDNLSAERITNDFGEDGLAILVDSFDATGNSKNFRYEFSETYKVIAPEWNAFDLKSTGIDCGVDVIPKMEQNQVCFASNVSNDIILASTANFDENRISKFMVQFVSGNNYIISYRYSVEVTQYILSNEAFSYFEALDQFSSTESLFSESQPGFLIGNVFSDDSPDEKVLGFFDVSTVSKKRIFLNYDDFYPGEDLPPYVNPCLEIAPKLISQGGARCILSALVDANQVSYSNINDDPPFEEGPYLVIPRECGDCTVLGSNEQPDFWIE
ncbi:DUF4249 domain-containing protein [Flagellimonas sp. CMM7]|uniref:DUF4249 domain-containing protein n=1 Tax=Flagellimonas sp. CMM7 TaxID=2654676 RepID=UPI0013CFF31C|nr:DUF4249 domain-containing protein [Flagellimonas sp. CMM7]UII79362.1 DUF4249 domain-containing protein [Flagellimonas sp. CMM7]